MDRFICEYDFYGFKKYAETNLPPLRISKTAILDTQSLVRSYPPLERVIDGHRYKLDEAASVIPYRTMVFSIRRERRKDMNTVEVFYEFERWE